MTVQSEVNPEQTGQSDHTGATDVPGSGNDDSSLNVPIVPTQDDLENQLRETNDAIAQAQTVDAPWGLRADGTPRAKPGRPPKGQMAGEQRDRLESVSPGKELPRTTSSPKALRPRMGNDAPIVADYVAMGQLGANLWFNAGEMIFGEDWRPDPNEPALIAGAFRNYFQAKEIKVLSPDLVLLFTLGTYAMARIAKPTVKSRLSGMIEWAKNKLRR